MIKNVKKKGKDTYLTHVCRHRWIRKSLVKIDEISGAFNLAFISYRCRLTKVLAGAAKGKREVRVGEAE